MSDICKILSDKAAKLSDFINNIDDESLSPINLTPPKRSTIMTHCRENIVFKSQIMWIIKNSQFQLIDAKPGKCIESTSVDVNVQDIQSLCLKLYPKGKNMGSESVELCVHFKSLPENMYVTCDIALIGCFKNIVSKHSETKDTCSVKENIINFDICSISKFSCFLVDHEKLIIQCRIQLLSKIYSCTSRKLSYTVKKLPAINRLNRDILKNGKYSDVTLEVDANKTKSHKFLLASESLSLNILLKVNYGDTQQLTEEKCSFQNLLKFIYTGSYRIFDFSDAMQLYIISCKYEILNLKNICSVYLIAGLNEKNISHLWDLSRGHKDKYLFNACTAFIKKHNIQAELFFS